MEFDLEAKKKICSLVYQTFVGKKNTHKNEKGICFDEEV